MNDWVSAIAIFEACTAVGPEDKDDNIDPIAIVDFRKK